MLEGIGQVIAYVTDGAVLWADKPSGKIIP